MTDIEISPFGFMLGSIEHFIGDALGRFKGDPSGLALGDKSGSVQVGLRGEGDFDW